MFNAALTTSAIDVDLPHRAGARARKIEICSRPNECCSGDTQRRRNARFLPAEGTEIAVAACALHNDGGRGDESVGWRALGPAIMADSSGPKAGRHTRSASLRRSSFLRSLGSSSFLRSLI